MKTVTPQETTQQETIATQEVPATTDLEIANTEKEDLIEKQEQEEPITFEAVTIPEGLDIADEQGQEFLDVLQNTASVTDKANALLTMQAKSLQASAEKAAQDWEDLGTNWAKQAQDDPDIGGDKLQGNLDTITAFLNGYERHEQLLEALASTKMDNNPEMIKFMLEMAKLKTEKPLVTGGAPTTNKSAADILFG